MYHVVIPNQVIGQLVNRILANSVERCELVARKSFFSYSVLNSALEQW